jgi:hypothetical protein
VLGGDRAADAHFAAALALEEAAGGPALAVRIRLAAARALLRRSPPERRRAGELLDVAEAAATRMGLGGAVAEAAALRAGP